MVAVTADVIADGSRTVRSPVSGTASSAVSVGIRLPSWRSLS